MGDQNFLHLDVGGASVTAAVDGSYEIHDGATIMIHLPESKIHLFDTESGEALSNCQRTNETIPTVQPTQGEEVA